MFQSGDAANYYPKDLDNNIEVSDTAKGLIEEYFTISAKAQLHEISPRKGGFGVASTNINGTTPNFKRAHNNIVVREAVTNVPYVSSNFQSQHLNKTLQGKKLYQYPRPKSAVNSSSSPTSIQTHFTLDQRNNDLIKATIRKMNDRHESSKLKETKGEDVCGPDMDDTILDSVGTGIGSDRTKSTANDLDIGGSSMHIGHRGYVKPISRPITAGASTNRTSPFVRQNRQNKQCEHNKVAKKPQSNESKPTKLRPRSCSAASTGGSIESANTDTSNYPNAYRGTDEYMRIPVDPPRTAIRKPHAYSPPIKRPPTNNTNILDAQSSSMTNPDVSKNAAHVDSNSSEEVLHLMQAVQQQLHHFLALNAIVPGIDFNPEFNSHYIEVSKQEQGFLEKIENSREVKNADGIVPHTPLNPYPGMESSMHPDPNPKAASVNKRVNWTSFVSGKDDSKPQSPSGSKPNQNPNGAASMSPRALSKAHPNPHLTAAYTKKPNYSTTITNIYANCNIILDKDEDARVASNKQGNAAMGTQKMPRFVGNMKVQTQDNNHAVRTKPEMLKKATLPVANKEFHLDIHENGCRPLSATSGNGEIRTKTLFSADDRKKSYLESKKLKNNSVGAYHKFTMGYGAGAYECNPYQYGGSYYEGRGQEQVPANNSSSYAMRGVSSTVSNTAISDNTLMHASRMNILHSLNEMIEKSSQIQGRDVLLRSHAFQEAMRLVKVASDQNDASAALLALKILKTHGAYSDGIASGSGNAIAGHGKYTKTGNDSPVRGAGHGPSESYFTAINGLDELSSPMAINEGSHNNLTDLSPRHATQGASSLLYRSDTESGTPALPPNYQNVDQGLEMVQKNKLNFAHIHHEVPSKERYHSSNNGLSNKNIYGSGISSHVESFSLESDKINLSPRNIPTGKTHHHPSRPESAKCTKSSAVANSKNQRPTSAPTYRNTSHRVTKVLSQCNLEL